MSNVSARDRILDAAESRARRAGYNGFSFRDLATDVGVKSASVHYHFPTKPDLVVALVTRYAARIEAHLGAPKDGRAALDGVIALFRNALVVQDQMCLCGLLGAEGAALPPEAAAAVRKFFEMLLGRLHDAFGADWAGPRPETVIAQLEGALIIARSLEDPQLFDTAVANLTASC